MAVEQSFTQATDLSGRAIRATNFALDYGWLWLVLAAAAAIILKLRAHHALIAHLDERADAAHGDVDALLIERHALIGNLAEVVRAFAVKEREVIRDVLDARVDALEAIGQGAIHNETQVAEVLQNLFTVSDRFPTLVSAGHYTTLRTDLIRTEERITAARKFYNLAVEELNAVRRAFPGNLLAKLSKSPARLKFDLGERRAAFSEPVKITL